MGSKSGTVLVVTLIFCVFMGVTAISMGLGTAFPSINRIASPLVCPAGSMEVEEHLYKPYPGKNVYTTTWYCVESDSKTKLGMFPMVLYAGSVYGLGLFAVLLLIGFTRRKAGPGA